MAYKLALKDMKYSSRHRVVREAITAELETIAAPIKTLELAERVAARLGETNKRYVGECINDVMNDFPECIETGETFKLYGRVCKRRMWNPRRPPSAALATAGYTPRPDLSGAARIKYVMNARKVKALEAVDIIKEEDAAIETLS